MAPVNGDEVDNHRDECSGHHRMTGWERISTLFNEIMPRAFAGDEHFKCTHPEDGHRQSDDGKERGSVVAAEQANVCNEERCDA